MKTAKTKSHSSPPRATNPQAREDAFFAKTLAESSEAPGLMQRKPAFGSEEGAVQARLENPAAGPHASKDCAAPAPAFFNTTGAGGFFSKAGTPFFTPARVQAKLNVGQQDDPAEHEADTVADQVVQELSQGVSAEDEELLQGKLEPVQRQGELEKEELLQGNFESVQRQDFEEEALLQGKFAASETPTHPGQQENRTGMPDNLKAGIESLSGMSMDDVKVHKNSSKPAQLYALAYTQGTDIEVGPGQERHLPHEGWHVVQQMQGRVKPTMQAKGVAINDDGGLEHEADVMGAKALQMRRSDHVATGSAAQTATTVQREREAEAARAVSARAFTVGRDVVFGPRQYVPETTSGGEAIGDPSNVRNIEGNDYYLESGTYIGSDGKGDDIRILNRDSVVVNKARNMLKANKKITPSDFVIFKKNSALFNKVPFNYITAKRIIVNYYSGHPRDIQVTTYTQQAETSARILDYDKKGVPKRNKFSVNKKTGDVYSKLKPTIKMHISVDGYVFKTFSNKYDLISTLVHEKSHLDEVIRLEKPKYGDKRFFSKGTNMASGDEAIKTHLYGAYADQYKHKDFQKTSIYFRKKYHEYLTDYLKNIKSNKLKNEIDDYYVDVLKYKKPT